MLVLACAGTLQAKDRLMLVMPVRHARINLQVEPMRAAPDVKSSVPRTEISRTVDATYMSPQDVIEGDLQRWGVGSIGRWLSIGGMALPSFTVSRVSWVPQAARQPEGKEKK